MTDIAGAPAPRGSEVVLLVEDANDLREVARRALERQGYTVFATANPIDALEVATGTDRRIDLLLTDVVMPRMNGLLLGKHFLELYPASKVLYMSGYTHDAIIENGALTFDLIYLQKPFTPHTLACRVRAVLDSCKAVSSTTGRRRLQEVG